MDKGLQRKVREPRKGQDEVRIAQILSECFGPITQRQLDQWMWKPEVKTFVCEIEGNIVSHVNVVFKELHLGEGVYMKTGGVGGVCTCSEQRKRGIMTSMMKQTLDYIKDAGVSNSALYTGLMLPAHRIYQRYGFGDVQTWSFYLKILDFPYVFRTWLRELNRTVKTSQIAQKTLRGWNRTIVFELQESGTQAFRFNHGRFQRLRRPPKSSHLTIVASWETWFRIIGGELRFEDAGRTGKISVKKGNEADLQMLNKILTRIWDE
jgi:GNAT superfamily N-acetyltransferase/putative sterol carrier protein